MSDKHGRPRTDSRPPLSPKSLEALHGLLLPDAGDMCIDSSSSSSTSISQSARYRMLRRASQAKQPVLDCADDDVTRYQVHAGGLLNRNRLAFGEVDFCFVCETPLKLDEAFASVECTGIKSDRAHYEGAVVAVYRQLFLCDKCYVVVLDARKRDASYRVKMAERALVYFR